MATPNTNPFPSDSRPPMAVEVGVDAAAPPGYRVVRLLGRGGMGNVYLVHNEAMDRPEVLKVVQPELLSRPGFRERFQREVRSAARLHHPNIVTAYCCLPVGAGLALAMEYVPGRDLHAVVRADGPLSVVAACHYVRQAALGLQHAHDKGMVHRDVKPHNLMLGKDGNKPVVKVLDFGLAKVTGVGSADPSLTGTNEMMGTPEYMAPEQILDAARSDIRADIYSLGCTLYYLLAGRSPFAGLSLYETLAAHHSQVPAPVSRADVPAELAAVTAKMMAKAPADRYQTPADVVAALTPFVRAAGKGRKPVATRVAELPYAEAVETVVNPKGGRTARPTPAADWRATPPPVPKRRKGRGGRLAAAVGVGLAVAAGGLWASGRLDRQTVTESISRPADPPPPEELPPVIDSPEKMDPGPLTDPVPVPKAEPNPAARLPALAGRTGPPKARQLAFWGGTDGSEAAVDLGLKWLGRQQRADGSWPPEDPIEDTVGATGLALLAYLGAGYTPQDRVVVRDGLQFLLENQEADGWIRKWSRSLTSHGLATAALCEALGLTGDRARFLKPAQRAVAYIVANQLPDGGWADTPTPGQTGSLTHVAVQVEALAAARAAGLVVPADTWHRVSKFLNGFATGRAKGRFGDPAASGFPLSTAQGLYVRVQADGWDPGHAEPAGVEYLLREPVPRQGAFDPTRVYYQFQVIRYHRGDPWHKTWNPAVRDLLVRLQAPASGPDAGSWDMADFRSAAAPGRLYSTCRAILILETYYREARRAK